MPPKISSPAPRRPHFIRAWREFRGLTQQQLADLLETSKQSVSRIESGEQPYTQDSLEAIAAHLRCSAADLLTHSPNQAAPDHAADEWSIFDLSPENQKRAKDVIRAFKATEGVEAAPAKGRKRAR